MISFSTNNGSSYEFNQANIVSIWKGLSSGGRLIRIYTVDGKMQQFETGDNQNDVSEAVFDSITLGDVK